MKRSFKIFSFVLFLSGISFSQESQVGVGGQFTVPVIGVSARYVHETGIGVQGIFNPTKFMPGYIFRALYVYDMDDWWGAYLYMQSGFVNNFSDNSKLHFTYSPGLGGERSFFSEKIKTNVELSYIKVGKRWTWAGGFGFHVVFKI